MLRWKKSLVFWGACLNIKHAMRERRYKLNPLSCFFMYDALLPFLWGPHRHRRRLDAAAARASFHNDRRRECRIRVDGRYALSKRAGYSWSEQRACCVGPPPAGAAVPHRVRRRRRRCQNARGLHRLPKKTSDRLQDCFVAPSHAKKLSWPRRGGAKVCRRTLFFRFAPPLLHVRAHATLPASQTFSRVGCRSLHINSHTLTPESYRKGGAIDGALRVVFAPPLFIERERSNTHLCRRACSRPT